MLTSVKVYVPIRPVALGSDDESTDSPQITGRKTYNFRSSHGYGSTLKPRNRALNQSTRSLRSLDNGDTISVHCSEHGCSWTDGVRVNGPSPQSAAGFGGRGRKALPKPPSQQLLAEIAELKDELRRKHISEVS